MTDTPQTPEEPAPVDEALVEHLCKTHTKAELAREYLRLEQRYDVAVVGARHTEDFIKALEAERKAHFATRGEADRLLSRANDYEDQLNALGYATLHRPHGSTWTAATITPHNAYEVRVPTGELLRLVAAENLLTDTLAELARYRVDSLATLTLADEESAS